MTKTPYKSEETFEVSFKPHCGFEIKLDAERTVEMHDRTDGGMLLIISRSEDKEKDSQVPEIPEGKIGVANFRRGGRTFSTMNMSNECAIAIYMLIDKVQRCRGGGSAICKKCDGSGAVLIEYQFRNSGTRGQCGVCNGSGVMGMANG